MKIKPLKPSQREKKRYLVFEIISKNKVKQVSDIAKAIWNSMLAFAGEKGASQAGIILLKEKFSIAKQKGIIKVNHKMLEILKSSLILIKEIGKEPVAIQSVAASGILKKAEKHIKGA
ncbi:Rpp14/Pop5 family protein [Candidatus Woesearchaeota archaeon]|nr:Rpp14/Pop5 family protein [Candidatus Woesearchaeota archaeon]MBW2978700.1 Rpp14/Pop5 family protein [Candidatus Woesearchaeota archaeon]